MKGTSCVQRLRLRSVWFLLCVLQQVLVPVCERLCVSWICGCRSHWDGCMNVACMGYVLGRKPEHETLCFPCKVAAAGDERYLGCGCGRFGSSYVFCNEWLFLCAKVYAFLESVVADRIVMAAWMLHGFCFGEEARPRNLAFFRVKWLWPAMKGTSCVRRLRLRSFWFLLCVLQRVVVPVTCVAWMLHGLCFGEEAGARNLAFFRVKWLYA